ncbi:MAG: manganese efflux pump [Candidatus Levybacteria bacterium]|nr:manganese efflux pump [Candidatus Levybacteria bacterium]
MTASIQLFIIAVSLALDALSVSVAGGMKSKRARLAGALKIAAFFGIFQALMPLIGWAIGEVLSSFVSQFAHWIAFGLLTIIGIKMIRESLDPVDQNQSLLDTRTLFLLAVATSIDALIVGITLPLLDIPLIISSIAIGIVTFVLCFFGFLFGKSIGKVFGKKVEILGGVALILIGLKILIENL